MRTMLLIGAALLLGACRDEQASFPVPDSVPEGTEAAIQPGGTVTPDEPVAPLADMIEHDPRFVVGISYAPEISQYPGLSAAVREYARNARECLDEAVQGMGEDRSKAPYELSLSFTLIQNTPLMAVVSGEGSLYVGKGDGKPLLSRFVWLPQTEKLLRVEDLISTQAGWDAVSSYVAEQMYTAVSTRMEDESLTPEERRQLQRTANKAIGELTKPAAENFSQFEPLLDGAGKIAALRFVFPPYLTSGPYSDGVQSVDVPMTVIQPHIGRDYQALLAN